MDICYYNTQLKDELDGATAYIQRAMHMKRDHPTWATMYAKMSSAELEHASAIMKMFEEDYKLTTSKMEKVPDCLIAVRTTLMDMYSEYTSKAKYLHETYESL